MPRQPKFSLKGGSLNVLQVRKRRGGLFALLKTGGYRPDRMQGYRYDGRKFDSSRPLRIRRRK